MTEDKSVVGKIGLTINMLISATGSCALFIKFIVLPAAKVGYVLILAILALVTLLAVGVMLYRFGLQEVSK